MQSAFRAGYICYAVDRFCDQDLFWYTRDRLQFQELDEIPGCIRSLCDRYPIDYIVYTSGAEDLRSHVPVLGTPAERLEPLLDKEKTHAWFTQLGIPTPALVGEDAYPLMAKPVKGAGGWRNRILHDDAEKTAWLAEFPDIPKLYQQIVEGIPASVSCLCDGRRARAVCVNEQLLRQSEEAPFGFSGCISPIVHPLRDRMIDLAERVVQKSGCVGSVGVDFVVSEDVWAIEINPRFQATLDTVEMSTGCNLFRMHVQACSGRVPDSLPMMRRFAARSILFADHDLVLETDLTRFAPHVADIPWPGTRFEKGEAVVSVYGTGSTRDAALSMLNTNITGIRRYIQQ